MKIVASKTGSRAGRFLVDIGMPKPSMTWYCDWPANIVNSSKPSCWANEALVTSSSLGVYSEPTMRSIESRKLSITASQYRTLYLRIPQKHYGRLTKKLKVFSHLLCDAYIHFGHLDLTIAPSKISTGPSGTPRGHELLLTAAERLPLRGLSAMG